MHLKGHNRFFISVGEVRAESDPTKGLVLKIPTFTPADDGLDTDADGLCDVGDDDDDNDTVADGDDSAPLDRLACADTDADG